MSDKIISENDNEGVNEIDSISVNKIENGNEINDFNEIEV